MRRRNGLRFEAAPLLPEAYDYDEAGNTVSRPSPSGNGTQTLVWDAEGNLVSVQDAGSVTQYVYDPDGQLLIESDANTSTLFLGDTEVRYNKLASTKDQILTAKRHYGTTANATATRSSDTKIDFQITDHHNTATVSLDGATVAATSRWNTPFGENRGTAPTTWPNTRGFLNKHHNPATGLTAVGARHYDAKLGKFISADPILDLESPQQLLGFNYANDNPLTFRDPSGLSPTFGAGISIGASSAGSGAGTGVSAAGTAASQPARNPTYSNVQTVVHSPTARTRVAQARVSSAPRLAATNRRSASSTSFPASCCGWRIPMGVVRRWSRQRKWLRPSRMVGFGSPSSCLALRRRRSQQTLR